MEWLQFLGVLVACVAAFIALLSVLVVKKTAEAQLYRTFLDEYGNGRMLDHLYELGQAQPKIKPLMDRQPPDDAKLRELLDEDEELNEARRGLKYYFFKALMLKRAGYVGEEFVRRVGDVNGRNLFFDVIVDMERAMNKKGYEAEKDKYEELRRIIRPE